MDEDGGALHNSDSEGLSEQLEVIFNQQNDKRRRASLREQDGERASSRSSRPQVQKRTSCFVHAMLEERFKAGMRNSTQAIPEDLYRPGDKQSSPTTPDGNGQHTQSRLLTKKYANHVVGRGARLGNLF